MVRAITIAREYGSGGAVVARLLADRLGWRLLDRDLLNEMARAANVAPAVAERFDERIDPWFHRLVKHALWRGAPDAPISVDNFDLFDAEMMAVVGRKVIEEAARMGNCVMVGRGGQCILHGWPEVFHVFLYAPIEIRKKRVAERRGPSQGAPESGGGDSGVRSSARGGRPAIFRPGVVQPESVRSDDQHQARL